MHWDGLEGRFEDLILGDKAMPLLILSPFITTTYLLELLNGHTEVHIVTSWRKEHLLAGVSSLDLYEAVRQREGWTLYINDRLHAKVYCRNFETVLVGSANLTRNGLGDHEGSNIELLVEQPCDDETERQLREILRTSMVMNDADFETYCTWYEDASTSVEPMETGSVITHNPERAMFLVSQLPASASPKRLWELLATSAPPQGDWLELEAAHHDTKTFGLERMALESYDEHLEALRDRMLHQSFFHAFSREIDTTGLHFGAAKQWILDRCIDDPVPYRSELTRVVQHLFSWTVELYPNEFEIVQPRHSQLLRRIAPQELNEVCEQTGRKLNRSFYVNVEQDGQTMVQYKSCPNCSLYWGHLVFKRGRVHTVHSDFGGTTQFGFTEKRVNRNNPDGIHSWCQACRGNVLPSEQMEQGLSPRQLQHMVGHEIAIVRKGA